MLKAIEVCNRSRVEQLETISRHNYTFATIFVLEARFKENLENMLKNDDDDDDHEEDVPDKFDCSERHFNLEKRGGPDFDNVENLEVTVLASLGIVLKVATLDEVKAMLQHDRYVLPLSLSPRTAYRIPILLDQKTLGTTLVCSTRNCSSFVRRNGHRSVSRSTRSIATTSENACGIRRRLRPFPTHRTSRRHSRPRMRPTAKDTKRGKKRKTSLCVTRSVVVIVSPRLVQTGTLLLHALRSPSTRK